VARDPAEIAATLGELGCLDLVELGQQAVLERIVQAAATCCGSTGGVGLLLLNPDQQLHYVAAAGRPRRSLAGSQVRLGEGPSVDAFLQDAPVASRDLAGEPRWPNFRPLALAAGIRAWLSAPVRQRHGPIGALDFARIEQARDSSWSASGSTRSRGRAAAPPGPDRGAAHPSRRRTPPFPPQSLTCTCPAPHHVGWQAAGIGPPLLQGHEQGKVGERQSLPAAHRHRLLLLGRCRPSSCPWPATAGPAPPPAARCHTPGTAGRRGCRTADRGCGTPGSASRSSAGCTDGRRRASASSCSSGPCRSMPGNGCGRSRWKT
jgi:hypothetical protein